MKRHETNIKLDEALEMKTCFRLEGPRTYKKCREIGVQSFFIGCTILKPQTVVSKVY